MPQCSRCRDVKDIEEFYVYRTTQRNRSGGKQEVTKVSGYCKACQVEYQRERNRRLSQKSRMPNPGFSVPIQGNGVLGCGCEPGWRCKVHARMKREGRPSKYSESVVMRVFNTPQENT